MTNKRIGVVFPGYGEQYIGMGKDLYDELRIVQELFEQAAGTAEVNFVKLIFASSDEEISSIRYSYLAIYLFEVSLYEVLASRGLQPDFVAGHGIGEYAATYATGSLSFVDGLYILNKYTQFYDEFMKDKPYSCLRIVREFEIESIEELCEQKSTEAKKAYVSAQNSPHAFYIAGHVDVVEKIQEYCIKEVIRKVRIISPAYGMQSSLVDEIFEQLKIYFHKIKFTPLKIPLITNVDGVYVTTPDALESAIMRKVNNRIQWNEVIKGFEGCDIILSVGPGEQLIEWFKEVYPDKEYHLIRTLKDIETIAQYFAKEEIIKQNITPEATAISNQKASEENLENQVPKDLYEADLVNEQPADFDVEDEDAKE
jgi:[acyl-carrier-protein] S-malonyltransferase